MRDGASLTFVCAFGYIEQGTNLSVDRQIGFGAYISKKILSVSHSHLEAPVI